MIENRRRPTRSVAKRDIVGITHAEPPLAEHEMFLYVHKRHEPLVPEIAEALRAMKANGSYTEILNDTFARVTSPQTVRSRC